MPELKDFTLYHRAVRDVRGEELLPLNELKDAFPDVYQREVQKYAGREQLQRERVLPLDCLWGDVLFLSPVNPKLLLDVIRSTGRAVPPVRFWAVNAAALEPGRACIKFVRPWPNGVYAPPVAEDYVTFTPENLARLSAPGAESLTRLSGLKPDAPLILWSDVPHVLYRGRLKLADLQEVWA